MTRAARSADQDVALAAGRQLERAVRAESLSRRRPCPRRSACRSAGAPPPLISLRASVRLSARPAWWNSSNAARRPSAARAARRRSAACRPCAPSSKVRRAVSAACVGRGVAVGERRRLGGEDLLGLVDLRALQRLEPRDLVERQLGEELQEAADVGVLGVAPELPEVVRADSGRR